MMHHDHVRFADGCKSDGTSAEVPMVRRAKRQDGSCFTCYTHTRDVIVIDTGQFIYRICRDCLNAVNKQVAETKP